MRGRFELRHSSRRESFAVYEKPNLGKHQRSSALLLNYHYHEFTCFAEHYATCFYCIRHVKSGSACISVATQYDYLRLGKQNGSALATSAYKGTGLSNDDNNISDEKLSEDTTIQSEHL